MKPKRLIYGIGVNDADYIVVKREELGYVDGKRCGSVATTKRGQR